MTNFSNEIDNYYANLGASDGNSVTALPPQPSLFSKIANPLMQGASFGLAGNVGLLPSDYAKQRKAHPYLYPALETVGEIGTGAALLPEMPELAAGKAATMAAKFGYNALTGALIGAGSTNVSGGNPAQNAGYGAVGGAMFAPLAAAASSAIPEVDPKVAQFTSAFRRMFGNEPMTNEQRAAQVSQKFHDFIANAGGIDMRTTVPELLDKTGAAQYPAQTLAERMNAIKFKGYSLMPDEGAPVHTAIDRITSAAKDGILSPEAYTQATQSSGVVGNLARTPYKNAGGDIRKSLDDALALQSSGLAERFNIASKAHKEAMRGVQDASNALTLANSRFLPTDNVYANSSTFPAVREATAKLESAQARADAAGAEKDKISLWLQGAQKDEAAKEAPDLAAINDAREAHRLVQIAAKASSGGKLTLAKLARAVNTHYKLYGEEAPSADDLTRAAVSPAHGFIAKAAGSVPYGAGIGVGLGIGGEMIGEHLMASFPGVVSHPLATGGGALALYAAGKGLGALRGTNMVANMAVNKALGKTNPLLSRVGAGGLTASALAGTEFAPDSSSNSSNDPVEDYYKNLK